jgi:hypothetical protein
MSYDNKNRGMISKNTTATQANHPDYKGSINIEGREYWLSAWVQDGKKGGKMEGKKYLSLSATAKDDQPQKSDTVIQSSAQSADLSNEEDLPF